PGGLLLASVPAHPMLWTGHDVSLHHHRRYRKAEFNTLFAPREWQIVRMTASFFLIFPLAAAIRLGRHFLSPNAVAQSDTRPVPEWMNRTLIGLHAAE